MCVYIYKFTDIQYTLNCQPRRRGRAGRQRRVEAPGGVVPCEGFAPETAAETVDGQALELRWSETFAHQICWYEMHDMIRLGWV